MNPAYLLPRRRDMSRPVHFEIATERPEKVGAFYRDVFGWKIATWEGPQTYWLVTTGAEGTPGINGGIMHRQFPQAVINTIGVASLDDTLAKVEKAGGKKVYGPHDIPNVGRHAYCTDPDGNYFGVLQPAMK
jgi:predicted enzyme related to lactoylglutathione lyase